MCTVCRGYSVSPQSSHLHPSVAVYSDLTGNDNLIQRFSFGMVFDLSIFIQKWRTSNQWKLELCYDYYGFEWLWFESNVKISSIPKPFEFFLRKMLLKTNMHRKPSGWKCFPFRSSFFLYTIYAHLVFFFLPRTYFFLFSLFPIVHRFFLFKRATPPKIDLPRYTVTPNTSDE